MDTGLTTSKVHYRNYCNLLVLLLVY